MHTTTKDTERPFPRNMLAVKERFAPDSDTQVKLGRLRDRLPRA